MSTNVNWDINRIENKLYTTVNNLAIKDASNANIKVFYGYAPTNTTLSEFIVCAVPTNVENDSSIHGYCLSRIAIWVKDSGTPAVKNRSRITKIHDAIIALFPLSADEYSFEFANEFSMRDSANGYSITYLNLETAIIK